MPFKKGESGNPKGRAKGAESKLTKEAREMFLDTLAKKSVKIDEAFPSHDLCFLGTKY